MKLSAAKKKGRNREGEKVQGKYKGREEERVLRTRKGLGKVKDTYKYEISQCPG